MSNDWQIALNKRYQGFMNTHNLWYRDAIYGLHQFDFENEQYRIDSHIKEKLRLGKYIEKLCAFQLSKQQSTSIISENLQIQSGKTTTGEIDFLIYENKVPIHLELVYKFYLFDSSVGSTEIDHLIGPNRKDALIKKLNKLKDKQLPMLYRDECVPYLEKLNLKSKDIQQRVCFKAQLFVPFSKELYKPKLINSNCIQGFYIHFSELYLFQLCKFFILDKKDWIVIPHKKVNWINYVSFELFINDFMKRNFSPMCWVKKPNGEILKLFVVWWP